MLVVEAPRQDGTVRIVMVARNVQVLTAGVRYDLDAAREDATPMSTRVVRLQVTPPEAERIALAVAAS